MGGQHFNPLLGFFAGWALLVASAVFMVSGTIPAATATLLLFRPELADNPATVTFVAAGWLLAVSAVLVKGIKPTSYSQVVMTGIEAVILLLIVLVAAIKFGGTPVCPLSLTWFSVAEFTPTLFSAGGLTALFFFWGWDVTVNLNEETRDSNHAPGLGAIWAMVIVLLLFVSFAMIFLVLWPLLSAAFLFFIAAYSIPTFDLATNVVGFGGIVIGIVPLLLNRRRLPP